MLRILVVALCLSLWVVTAPAVVNEAPAAEDTAPVDPPEEERDEDPQREAVRADLRKIEWALEDHYKKCELCEGKGKIGKRDCYECAGFARTYQGGYQFLVDQYIAYCKLFDKHAAVLKQHEDIRERAVEHRKRYLFSITQEMGPKLERNWQLKGGEVELVSSKRVDGQYNELAHDLVRGAKGDPAGKGVALRGQVVRTYERDDRRVAKVRTETVELRSRVCYVIMPDDLKWKDFQKVRVIGQIVKAEALRGALPIRDDKTIIIAPVHGTE